MMFAGAMDIGCNKRSNDALAFAALLTLIRNAIFLSDRDKEQGHCFSLQQCSS